MPSGFVNIGNTCYINSALQCLLRCDALNELLNTTNINVSSAHQQFLKEYDDLRRLALTSNVIVRPERFIQHIQMYARHRNINAFMNLDQNDVCEFIHFMIDAFHLAFCADPPQTPEMQSREMVNGRFQSPIVKLFFGVNAYVITETGTNTVLATTPEPFFLLDIPITATSLMDCLNNYAAAEPIDAWRDDAGNTHSVTRKCVFVTLPPILFIALKRFTSNGRKDISNVDIPEAIVVSGATYKLVAVCVHSGNVGGGHYTACVLNEQQWTCIDDDVIMPTTTPAKNGYCFVFQQQ